MVKREQVYMPSSDSVTSLMLMVSSDQDAWTSSILLSRKAGERERGGGHSQERFCSIKTFKTSLSGGGGAQEVGVTSVSLERAGLVIVCLFVCVKGAENSLENSLAATRFWACLCFRVDQTLLFLLMDQPR